MCVCVCTYVLGDGVAVFRTADVFITFNLCETEEQTKCFTSMCCPLAWTHRSIQQTAWVWAKQGHSDEKGRFDFLRASMDS